MQVDARYRSKPFNSHHSPMKKIGWVKERLDTNKETEEQGREVICLRCYR